MRGTIAKKIRRSMKKQANETIDAFVLFVSSLGLKARIKLCYRIIFKKKKIL